MAGLEQHFQPRKESAQSDDNNVRVNLHAETVTTLTAKDSTTKYADGTVVREDSQGHVLHVDRTNGTSVDLAYTNNLLTTLIERKGDKSWTWNRQDGTDYWHSMDMLGSTLVHMSVNSRGQESYEAPNETNWIVNGDGSKHYQLKDGTSGNINAEGQLTDLQRPDGSRLIASYTKGNFDRLREVSKNHRVDWSKEPVGTWVTPQGSSIRENLAADIAGHEGFVEIKNGRVQAIDYLSGYNRQFGYHGNQIVSVKEHSASGDRTWSRVGNSDVWKSGNFSEVRHDVSVDRSGNYSYIDTTGTQHLYRSDDTEAFLRDSKAALSPAIEAAKEQLQKFATQKLSNMEEVAGFRKDVDDFVRRAPVSNVSDSTVLAALSDVTALLEGSPSGAKITGDDRMQLAEETLHHIANPLSSNQNPFGSCAATTAETVIADRAPDKFTSLIRQIADTGKFVSTSGKIVELAPDQYAKDYNSKSHEPYDDGGTRSYASQLFQLVATNAAYASEGRYLHYYEVMPTAPLDTGERLTDTVSGATPTWEGLNDVDIKAIGQEVANMNIPVWYQGRDFSNSAELEKLMRNNNENASLPAILFVMPKNEPFYGLTGHPLLGKDAPGGHFVTLWGIDQFNNVLAGNQWGTGSHWEGLHRIPLAKIYDGSKK